MGDASGGSIQSWVETFGAGGWATLRFWPDAAVDARGLRFLLLVDGVESILSYSSFYARDASYLRCGGTRFGSVEVAMLGREAGTSNLKRAKAVTPTTFSGRVETPSPDAESLSLLLKGLFLVSGSLTLHFEASLRPMCAVSRRVASRNLIAVPRGAKHPAPSSTVFHHHHTPPSRYHLFPVCLLTCLT